MDDRWCYSWVKQGLTSHQTHYRSYRGRVLWVKRPNQQCQSTEGREVLRTRLQSHQVHPSVLTITQHVCSMKKNTKYTQTQLGYAQWNAPSVTKPMLYVHWLKQPIVGVCTDSTWPCRKTWPSAVNSQPITVTCWPHSAYSFVFSVIGNWNVTAPHGPSVGVSWDLYMYLYSP